jgi:hypothetical protein
VKRRARAKAGRKRWGRTVMGGISQDDLLIYF